MAYDLAVIIHFMLKAGYLAISVIGKFENYKAITLLIAETNLLSFLSVLTFLWKYTIYTGKRTFHECTVARIFKK